jgi:hypothetical protein
MRAFYESLGFMAGLEDIGVLPAAKYMAGVSGSTWMLWTFLASEFNTFSEFLAHARNVDIWLSVTWERIKKDRADKGWGLGLVDFWAAFLSILVQKAGNLPANTPSILRITEKRAKSGLPLPIATFIESAKNQNYKFQAKEATWFEVTPYTLGCASPKSDPNVVLRIPTEAFGAEFKEGVIAGAVAQDDIAFLIAVAGSAFAASLADIADLMPIWLRLPLKVALAILRSGGLHLVNPEIFDYRKGAPSPMCRVRDAGISLNMPFMPLLRRDCNVIIVMDSTNVDNAEEMRVKAVAWFAEWQKRYFPEVAFPDVDSTLQKHFKDKSLPHAFYHLKSSNSKYHLIYLHKFSPIGTFSIKYSATDREKTIDDPRNFVNEHKEDLKKILREIAESLAANQ